MELICNLYFKLGRGRSLLARVSSQKLSLYSVFCIRRRSVIQGCNAASSLPALHPSLPFQVGPLNAARGLGSAQVPQRSNLVHFSLKIWHLVAPILLIFLRINWTQCMPWPDWGEGGGMAGYPLLGSATASRTYVPAKYSLTNGLARTQQFTGSGDYTVVMEMPTFQCHGRLVASRLSQYSLHSAQQVVQLSSHIHGLHPTNHILQLTTWPTTVRQIQPLTPTHTYLIYLATFTQHHSYLPLGLFHEQCEQCV